MQHHFIPTSEYFLPPKETLLPRPQLIAPVEQLPPLRIIWMDEVSSTHNLLKTPEYSALPDYTMVVARRQTAGRGQRGNSWESQDYMNLTFSMPVTPDWIQPSMQFVISEAMALAVIALLQEYSIEASVKWPNDIYVGDKKICGILIDHSLYSERIAHTVMSAGLNVNQVRFVSDAPNPVSMLQLLPTGSPAFDLEPLARRLQYLIYHMLHITRTPAGRLDIHETFMRRLYRNDNQHHPYFDHLRGEKINAIISDVATDGMLSLLTDGARPEIRTYAFKEVSFII